MHEVANSIWKRVLKREVSQEVALKVFQEFVKEVVENGLVTLEPISTELLNSALRLASEEKITVYDSEFIELARQKRWRIKAGRFRGYLKRASSPRTLRDDAISHCPGVSHQRSAPCPCTKSGYLTEI